MQSRVIAVGGVAAVLALILSSLWYIGTTVRTNLNSKYYSGYEPKAIAEDFTPSAGLILRAVGNYLLGKLEVIAYALSTCTTNPQ